MHTLLTLARRYVHAEVIQDGPDLFIVGVEPDELPELTTEERSDATYTADELGTQVITDADEYITDPYELPTMAKLYL